MNNLINNPDYVFICRKCDHRLYTPNVNKLFEMDCPACGEESSENWILKRKGNYNKEFEDEQEKSKD